MYWNYNSSKVNKRNKIPDPRRKVLRQSYSVPRKYIVAHFVNFCNHKMTAAGKKKRLRTIADAFPPDFLPKHGGNPARAEITLSAAPGQLH